MSKYLYVIMHLPIQRYLKWWAYRFAYLKELFFVRICETNPAYLTDCLKAKFLKFIIKGKTEQGENPSPTNPQEIINVEGKNKFNYIKASNIDNTEVTQYRIFEIDGLIPNTEYNINNMKFTQPLGDKYCYLWNAKTYSEATAKYGIAGITTYINQISFMSNAEGKIYLAIYPTDVSTWNNVITYLENAQIELGTTATPYVPYNNIQIVKSNSDNTVSKTYNFPLSQGQKLMEGSYLAEDGIHHIRGQKIFDGSEDELWGRSTSLASFYNDDLVSTAKINGNYLCNYFMKIANSTPFSEMNNGETKYNSTTSTRAFFKNTEIADIESFRLWLSTHNVTVEYELAEETIESYTQEQKTVYDEIINDGTYKGITNISVTANINPDLYIEYKSSKEEE